MSIEAYKIAIQITLTENVTRALTAMSGKFTKVNGGAQALQDRLQKIRDIKIRGLEIAGAGYAGLKLLQEPLDKAMQYERYVAHLRQMGLGDAQIADADKFVKATDIINTSVLDRMRIFSEAQASFRESGMDVAHALDAAKEMTPILANYEVASSTLSGDKKTAAEMQMRNLNKVVEVFGGIGNMERAKAITDGVFKSVQSSGKMVDERQLKQFLSYGSSATNQQNLRTVFGGLEPIIGELGGSTVGQGLNTAYIRMNGMTALLPKLAKHEMQRLGLTDATGKRQTTDLMHLQATDLVAYAKEIEARYAKVGITSRVDMERENSILFSRNGAKVMNKVMSQMSVIESSLAAYDKSKGAADVVNDPKNKRLLALQNFQKKWEDLQLVLAQDGGLIDLATRAFQWLGNTVEKITKVVHENPELAQLAVKVIAFGSATLIAGGWLMIARASFMGIILPIQGFHKAMLALNTVRKWNPAVGPMVRRMASAVGRGLSLVAKGLLKAWPIIRVIGQGVGRIIWGLARVLLFAGRALLMNPIGIVITAIAVAAYLLYKHWDAIKPRLLAAWTAIKGFFAAGGKWIVSVVQAMWNGTKALFSAYFNMWMSIGQFVVNGLSGVYNAITGWLHRLIDWIANSPLGKAIGWVKDKLEGAPPAAGNAPGAPKTGSAYIAPPNRNQTVQVHSTINMDGRAVATSVTTHQAREMSRPGTSAPGFDPTMGPMPVGLGAF